MTMQKAGIKNIIIDIPVHHYGKLEKDKIFTKGEDYYILGKLKLSERGEKDFIALYELAVQASELERFDEALGYWKKLSEVKPDFPKAYFGLANSYYRQSKFQEAIDSLETALKLEKNPEERREFIPLYAACSICIGKAEKCISLLKDTLSKYPELPMVVLMLALVYCCINKKDDAKKYLSLLKKRMTYDNYLYEFAEFLIKAGNLNYAISIIETALDTGTQDERFPILLDRCEKLLTEEN
ncbi:MAG: tetratricopeptide repeat protein [Nitrospirae bacterium]|nr:tetratricopeptide repeat protein [Nitrospirota bacterium]